MDGCLYMLQHVFIVLMFVHSQILATDQMATMLSDRNYGKTYKNKTQVQRNWNNPLN